MSGAEQHWWRMLWMMVGAGVEWNTARQSMVPLERIRAAAMEFRKAEARAHAAFLRAEIRKLGEEPSA